MDTVRRRAGVCLFATAAAIWLADRLTKRWAAGSLPGHPIDVINGVLTFRFAANPGGAFSLGTSAPLLFAAATALICGVIVVTSFRHTRVTTAIALGMILGGGVGNLTDRLLRGPHFTGTVVDFIDLHIWPIFNLADSAIVIGAVLLAATTWLGGRRDRTEASDGA